jgi:hypothetical protein
MSFFKVAARAILELGAELISSDAVAIYELVKNAIDAQSPNGVSINFCVTLRHSDYADALTRMDELISAQHTGQPADPAQVEALRTDILQVMLPGAPAERRLAFERALQGAATLQGLRAALETAYVENNWIEFEDTGHGMSLKDLEQTYLLIGTSARRDFVQAAIKEGQKAPYLGEKGVGRLSAMRLGSKLFVSTARKEDTRFNTLEVDWNQFADDSKLIEKIELSPRSGPKKADPKYSGTVIRITDLQESWSPRRIKDINVDELSRLWDPFSAKKRRFRVAIFFNGDRVDIPRLDTAILELAHARLTGRYEIVDGTASLKLEMWCGDLGKGNLPETRSVTLDRIDLRSLERRSATSNSWGLALARIVRPPHSRHVRTRPMPLYISPSYVRRQKSRPSYLA